MADFSNRDEWERRLGRVLGRLLREQLADLLDMLEGDDGTVSLNNVPDEYWREVEQQLTAALTEQLQGAALDSAEQFLGSSTIGVDWGLVNQRAASWARTYSFNLVKDINSTTRAALQEKIAAFYEQQQTIGQLRKSLESLYGPVRADLIASTEITRAAVEGERVYVEQLNQQGVQLGAVWQTSNDERVCPICGPRHDKPQGAAWQNPPPAHPRCRCWLSWEVING